MLPPDVCLVASSRRTPRPPSFHLVRRGTAAAGQHAANLHIGVLDVARNESRLLDRAGLNGARVVLPLEAQAAAEEVVAEALLLLLRGLGQGGGTILEEEKDGEEEGGADGDQDEAATERGHGCLSVMLLWSVDLCAAAGGTNEDDEEGKEAGP